MQSIEQKPKICSKEWLEAEVKRTNREVCELRKRSLALESENTTLKNDLLKQRQEIFHLKNTNNYQKKQIKELFYLTECFEEAIAENKKLAKELNRRSGRENPYGLSTPSSKQVKKKNSTKENQRKRGGGVKGHKGYGRQDFTKEEADRVLTLTSKPPACGCGGGFDIRSGTPYCVVHYIPSKIERRYYEKKILVCSTCGCSENVSVPGILPGYTYSNSTIGNMLAEHYFYGATVGSLIKRWNIKQGSFFNFAHKISDRLLPVFDKIVLNLRSSFIIHADETPWKKDGVSGYAWFFGNEKFKVFAFRHTRGSEVPIAILGTDALDGVLITDRYGGYVRTLKISRQYCLVHIIRDVKKEEEAFPEEDEVQKFTADLKPLLSKAISLRNEKKDLGEYLTEAKKLQKKIMDICNMDAKDPAVQHLQNIFREHKDKLFQWVDSPEIPADNNYAERALRPTVIARKISFGSQSERGLKTREILMTILHTAETRGWNPGKFLEESLNLLSKNPNADIYKLLLKEKQCSTSEKVA